MPKKQTPPPFEAIVKQTGDEKWIVANRYDGKKVAGPFDDEFEAFQSMKGKKKSRDAKAH